MLRRTSRRRLAAAVLIVLGLLTAFAAQHARRVGSRLNESYVVVGESSASTPDPGNEQPFEPFAFGVVDPLHGSAGALERAFDVLHGAGGADFVVLLGDVTETGDEAELQGLVATWQDAGVERIAIAGARDVARAGEFEAYVSPLRWWIRRNGCLFVGLSGQAGDAEFVANTAAAAEQADLVVGFAADEDGLAALSPALAFGPPEASGAGDVRVQRVQLLAGGAHAVASWNVSRSPTLRSFLRDVELRVLHPLVAGTLGFVLVLLGCVLCVGLGFRMLRAPPGPPAPA